MVALAGWCHREVKMETKEALWWVHNTAADMAEKGLMFHQFNHSDKDSLNLRREKISIDIAVYLYSAIWNIDSDIVRIAIMEISKTYSKGNLYGAKELDRDIKKLVENKTGREIEVVGTDKTVKDVINHLFLLAAEKYQKSIKREKYASSEYITLKDAIYNIVFHVWRIEEKESIDGPILASYVNMHMIIEATVKEIAEKVIVTESVKDMYERHCREIYKKRR